MLTTETKNQPQLPNLLRKFLVRKKIRPAELSRQSGVPKPSISNILSGKRGAAAETLAAFSKALGLSSNEAIELFMTSLQDSSHGDVRKIWDDVAQVITHAAISPKRSGSAATSASPDVGQPALDLAMIPIFSSIESKMKRGKIVGEQVGEFPYHSREAMHGAFCLVVNGDAMNGPDSWIRNADLAAFNPVTQEELKDGDICCLSVGGWKESAVRRIQKDPRGILFLRPDNTSFPAIEIDPRKVDFVLYGKLIGIWRSR